MPVSCYDSQEAMIVFHSCIHIDFDGINIWREPSLDFLGSLRLFHAQLEIQVGFNLSHEDITFHANSISYIPVFIVKVANKVNLLLCDSMLRYLWRWIYEDAH
ncbi:hypothetical protein ACJW31_01G102700 [Castanea mollissima]